MKQDSKAIRDEDFLDPFTGVDRSKPMQNTTFEAGKISEQTEKAR